MASKTLWDFYDGEPFMENPMLGIIGGTNPRKGKKMAVRRKRRNTRTRTRNRVHHRKHSPPRAKRRSNPKRRRRNWLSPGMVVPANPHHRRRRARSANPKRRHHRRRHNPAFMGIGIPPIKTIMYAGLGFVGPSFISSTLTTAAPSLMSSITSLGITGKYIMKIGSVALLTWAAKKFGGPAAATSVAIGGGVNIAVSLVNDFVPGILPANPLSMYLPTAPGMKAYVPMSGLQGVRGVRGLQAAGGAYGIVPSQSRMIPTAALYPTSQTNQTVYGRFGGTPSRFMRF